MGLGGVEYRLVLLLFDRGVQAGEMSLERLVAITAHQPRPAFRPVSTQGRACDRIRR